MGAWLSGEDVGLAVLVMGLRVKKDDGFGVGDLLGLAEGFDEYVIVGRGVGSLLGLDDGEAVGDLLGLDVGKAVGEAVGSDVSIGTSAASSKLPVRASEYF